MKLVESCAHRISTFFEHTSQCRTACLADLRYFCGLWLVSASVRSLLASPRSALLHVGQKFPQAATNQIRVFFSWIKPYVSREPDSLKFLGAPQPSVRGRPVCNLYSTLYCTIESRTHDSVLHREPRDARGVTWWTPVRLRTPRKRGFI
jgi:hypothetical protein